MLSLIVLMNGCEYQLPDASAEKDNPILHTLKKGLLHIFKNVQSEYPDKHIQVVWDEDCHNLHYFCDSLSRDQIAASLKKHNGGLTL